MFYTYDLELDPSFVPQPIDGEVESFELMPIGQVMEIVESDPVTQAKLRKQVRFESLLAHILLI